MNALTEKLIARKGTFAPVMDVDADDPGLVTMDFTANNAELTEALLSDVDGFSTWVEDHIRRRQGKIGIGGYAEHRTIYRVSEVFDAVTGQQEPRRLHLGVDLWAVAGSPVRCPWPATVHSFGDQDRKGDYGAVIILSHEWDGVRFHTLYGHLARKSLQLSVGQSVEAGQVFAWLGEKHENGHWPPHLHFQVIHDIGSWTGDYPGVCAYSDRARWLENCPDPDLMLDLNRYL